jgi:hypothetical protein
MDTIQTNYTKFAHKTPRHLRNSPNIHANAQLTFLERDETKDSGLNDAMSEEEQMKPDLDDKLTIEFDNQDHFVDTIV